MLLEEIAGQAHIHRIRVVEALKVHILIIIVVRHILVVEIRELKKVHVNPNILPV